MELDLRTLHKPCIFKDSINNNILFSLIWKLVCVAMKLQGTSVRRNEEAIFGERRVHKIKILLTCGYAHNV